jgi:hypothetical protein
MDACTGQALLLQTTVDSTWHAVQLYCCPQESTNCDEKQTLLLPRSHLPLLAPLSCGAVDAVSNRAQDGSAEPLTIS